MTEVGIAEKIKDVGHELFMQNPDKVNIVLLTYLSTTTLMKYHLPYYTRNIPTKQKDDVTEGKEDR